jgi:hypothetical protein
VALSDAPIELVDFLIRRIIRGVLDTEPGWVGSRFRL